MEEPTHYYTIPPKHKVCVRACVRASAPPCLSVSVSLCRVSSGLFRRCLAEGWVGKGILVACGLCLRVGRRGHVSAG